jgi:hypothetical protein
MVACDDFLVYKPGSQPVQVRRNGTNLNFILPLDEEKSPPLELAVGKSIVVYFKHFETGCEFEMRPTGEGSVTIPHNADFDSRYFYCPDDKDEGDSRSPFESCLRKELGLGLSEKRPLTEKQIKDKWREPDKTIKVGDRRKILFYQDVKVTLEGGKVSDVEIGDPPQ